MLSTQIFTGTMLQSLICPMLVVLLGQSDGPVVPSEPDPLAVIRSAFDASSNSLRSGIGKGTFRIYERRGDTGKWKLVNEAAVESHFDGSRFHIVLDFTENYLNLDRQVIIYDGSAVFTSRFSEQIKPLGSQTSVYEVAPTSSGLVRPVRAGFPWDVTKLGSALVDINKLIENIGEDSVTITRTPDGDYVGEHKLGTTGRVVIKWLQQYGYNVSLRQSFATADGEPVQEHVATWQKSRGVWYVNSLSNWGKYPEREMRSELGYDSFEVNAEVSSDMFSMDALSMPSGSRILDQRAEVTEPIHYVPYEDDEIEAKLGDMVSQLESLPTDWQPAGSTKPGRSFGKLMIVLVNVIIIAAIVVMVVLRTRHASR